MTKFNFSNMDYREMTVKLSNNKKELLYRDSDMRREKSLEVNSLKGLLYGGTTETFRVHRKRILKLHLKYRESAVKGTPHFDDRRSTETNRQALIRTEEENEQIFHAWQCVSLFRNKHTTFDLVIRNRNHLMALIHFVHTNAHKKIDPEGKLFNTYKWCAFKMKLSYESWLRQIKLLDLIKGAIFKTLVEKQKTSAYTLSTFTTQKYNSQHGLFGLQINNFTTKEREMSNNDRISRLGHHIKLFTSEIERGMNKDYYKNKMKK